MIAFNRSDLWFGVVIAIFFVVAAFVFFGQAVSDRAFWSMMLPVIGCISVISLVRSSLAKLGWAPRAVTWFSIGFTAATFVAAGGGHNFSLVTSVGSGLALAVFDFVSDKYMIKKEAES